MINIQVLGKNVWLNNLALNLFCIVSICAFAEWVHVEGSEAHQAIFIYNVYLGWKHVLSLIIQKWKLEQVSPKCDREQLKFCVFVAIMQTDFPTRFRIDQMLHHIKSCAYQ